MSGKRIKSDWTGDQINDLANSLARGLQSLEHPGVRLIQAFLQHRKNGEPVPEAVLAKIEQAFTRIAAGESADVVLGVKRERRGKPSASSIMARNIALAWKIHDLRAQGLTVDQAVERVSVESKIGEEVLRKIMKKYSVSVNAEGILIRN